MKKFKLHYRSDNDDSCAKYFESEKDQNIGDVIRVSNGYYHCIYNITIQKTGVRLDLAKSASSPAEALLLAEQAELYPKGVKPRGQLRRA